MKICTQTSVAEVDNSALECEKLIKSDCIIYEEAISYLGLQENATMTEVIEAMLLSLIDARSRIITLETAP